MRPFSSELMVRKTGERNSVNKNTRKEKRKTNQNKRGISENFVERCQVRREAVGIWFDILRYGVYVFQRTIYITQEHETE